MDQATPFLFTVHWVPLGFALHVWFTPLPARSPLALPSLGLVPEICRTTPLQFCTALCTALGSATLSHPASHCTPASPAWDTIGALFSTPHYLPPLHLTAPPGTLHCLTFTALHTAPSCTAFFTLLHDSAHSAGWTFTSHTSARASALLHLHYSLWCTSRSCTCRSLLFYSCSHGYLWDRSAHLCALLLDHGYSVWITFLVLDMLFDLRLHRTQRIRLRSLDLYAGSHYLESACACHCTLPALPFLHTSAAPLPPWFWDHACALGFLPTIFSSPGRATHWIRCDHTRGHGLTQFTDFTLCVLRCSTAPRLLEEDHYSLINFPHGIHGVLITDGILNYGGVTSHGS